MCHKYLKAKEFTIREVASLIGTLVSMFPGVEFGPLYYRSLEHDKVTTLKFAAGDFEKKMALFLGSIDELKWWITALPTAFRTINHGTWELTLNTDASQIGCGQQPVKMQHKVYGLPKKLNIISIFVKCLQ
jgi:hypothetical protein